jgi:hypothetical protein
LNIREATGQAQEYWYWHDKTKTIRLVENGSKCLQWDHSAKALATGVRAVARNCDEGKDEKQAVHYVKENYHFVSDANAKLCLSTKDSKNTEDKQAIFETCTAAGKAQNWYPMYKYQATGPHWNRQQNE